MFSLQKSIFFFVVSNYCNDILVEKVVVDLNLGVGSEIVGEQHYRDCNMHQFINLQESFE
jgi:hypothetical protein